MQLGLFKNFRLKLTAVFLASLFWFAIIIEKNFVYDLDVRIEPTNIPESKVIANEIPPFAKVRFDEQGKNLLALLFSDKAVIQVDLSQVEEEQALPLRANSLRISRSFQSSYHILSPDSIIVRLAPLAAKRVPIFPEVHIVPEPGFILVGGVKPEPDSVEITGPFSFVEKIDHITTISQKFTNGKYGFQGELALVPPPDSMKITLSRSRVAFSADIQKLLETEIAEAPVQVINVPRNLQATSRPSTAKLTVIGGERLLMSLTRENFEIIVDYKDRSRESLEGYIPIVRCPDDVQIKQIIPAKIKLEIKRKGAK